MLINLIGRVSNIKLPSTKALLPLYEAIINSFQSIEDLHSKDHAYINIYIKREESQTTFADNQPIKSIVVEDNGVGFNNLNFKSFETSDSLLRASKGGKGIGRFLWLKAFENVSIRSVYEDGGKFFERTFKFNLDDQGIHEISVGESQQSENRTTVHLNNFFTDYRDKAPKKAETIAAKIIEHCLAYFVIEPCPQVTIIDGDKSLSLKELFNENIKTHSKRESFVIKKHEFQILSLRLYSSEETQHKVHFCANSREVDSENLTTSIPNLKWKIKDEDDHPFLYVAYIFGKYLDENVNSERTDFALSENPSIDFPDDISKAELREYTVEKIKDYLSDYLEPIRKEKLENIKTYIYNENPKYRPVLKYKEESIDSIPPDLPSEKLEIELYKLFHKIELDLKKQGNEILRSDLKDIRDVPKYKEEYKNYIEKLNDFGQSNLAQYIVHRKTILDLLSSGLDVTSDGSYNLEESVHEIIFPMRTDSDEILYEHQNLWIIDERLSYHFFLASDKPLNQVINTDSRKEPDLLIYNKAFAFADEAPYSSVVIVEFKRPGRTDYDDKDKNPISQVYNYIRDIRAGKQKNRIGRPINVSDDSPFFGYIVCDINDRLRGLAENANLKRTPDGEGYFGANEALRTYMEIISYNKLLNDAKKRNRILFEKLHLPLI
jgi:hypothetical protein